MMNSHYLYIQSTYPQLNRNELPTIPNKNIMERVASMDNPAPDNDASVKSLGIFLRKKEGCE